MSPTHKLCFLIVALVAYLILAGGIVVASYYALIVLIVRLFQ